MGDKKLVKIITPAFAERFEGFDNHRAKEILIKEGAQVEDMIHYLFHAKDSTKGYFTKVKFFQEEISTFAKHNDKLIKEDLIDLAQGYLQMEPPFYVLADLESYNRIKEVFTEDLECKVERVEISKKGNC